MIKEEYVFMLCAFFIDQVSRIINNTNILTDGRWRCYNEMSQRICYRYASHSELTTQKPKDRICIKIWKVDLKIQKQHYFLSTYKLINSRKHE